MLIWIKCFKNVLQQQYLQKQRLFPVISQLRKEGPKELRYEPISVFHMDERPYILPNISNILFLELRKEAPKDLMHEPVSVLHVGERAYLFPNIKYRLCKNLTKSIFQLSLSRNLQGPVVSQLRKEGAKELLQAAVSLCHVDERAYFLPNISNILIFGTDNPV